MTIKPIRNDDDLRRAFRRLEKIFQAVEGTPQADERDVLVTLAIKDGDGGWRQLATARTDENGRVRSFGDQVTTQVATYKLTFDMSQYADKDAQPFFPEIDVVFQVRDPSIHYHVPVVVSPYGYSTYRGN